VIVVGVCQENVGDLLRRNPNGSEAGQELATESGSEHLARSSVDKYESVPILKEEGIDGCLNGVGKEILSKKSIGFSICRITKQNMEILRYGSIGQRGDLHITDKE
jgi:hypothetical protein